jgi:hypothetical protein
MKTYVAFVGEKAVLAFRAEDNDQAHAMIDDEEGSIRSDLKVLIGADEKPLWDGKSAIRVREATAAQHAEWEQSRDQAISDEEIDLDAGDDPDEWSVYLTRVPRRSNLGVAYVGSQGTAVSKELTQRRLGEQSLLRDSKSGCIWAWPRASVCILSGIESTDVVLQLR